jgi:CHAD domain-containing protein
MASKTKSPPGLRADMPVAEAIRAILTQQFAAMRAHQEPARQARDIEGVHQMRVALRRMRSALSLFRGVLDAEDARQWREQMRELASQLGRARDLDVFIAEGLAATAGKLPLPGEADLRALAIARRAEIQTADVLPLLESERYRQFCAAFPAWLENGLEPPPADSQAVSLSGEPDAATSVAERKRRRKLERPIIDSARKWLDKQERKLLDLGRGIDRQDAPAMHRLRIECKKLRYAAEFFRPLFPGMGQFITSMKGIQDVLGVMNDLALTQSLLEDLLRARPEERDLQRYAGALIGWRSYHFQQLLDDFDNRWEALVAARRPWWDLA